MEVIYFGIDNVILEMKCVNNMAASSTNSYWPNINNYHDYVIY